MNDVDVVVIGTGAGGAPLLAKLAQAGLRVVALEAGRAWPSPRTEYVADEIGAADLYWLEDRLVTGTPRLRLGGNVAGTGVGGSTLHYGAFLPRADARDLRLHTEFGKGVDWPISHEELVPFYEELEAFLGVSGPSPYPWDPARHYPLGPIAINGPGQLMQKGFAAIGKKTSAAPLGTLSEPRGSRGACWNCGFCHQGCPNGSKASMDVTYLPAAVSAGAIIHASARAFGFERDASGSITAVIHRGESGVEHRLRCRAVVLAAGAIETPRLLLHTGLANGSGQVGKNFMAHVATQVWGTWDEPIRMNKGFPATVISEDTLRPEDATFAGGYLVQSLGVVPVTWAEAVARSRELSGPALVRYLDQYDFVAGIGINGDCLPSKDNLLRLSDEKDAYGVPRAAIHYDYGPNEWAMHEHAEALMKEAWRAAGARDIWTATRVAHTIGTCRMGHSAEDSVVDPFGKSHEIDNLWICDNSVFPSALAANPALTIMALSLRTAQRLLERSAGH